MKQTLLLNIFSYPFINPEEFILGKGFEGDQQILKKIIPWSGIENAHSFFAEIIFDFGWIGFIIIIWFFLSISVYYFKRSNIEINRFVLLTTIFFLITMNVSSSIVGKHYLWIPYFIISSYSIRMIKISSNQKLNKL